jgi:hypothetical protein
LKAIVRDADQVYCFDWRVKAFSYFQSSWMSDQWKVRDSTANNKDAAKSVDSQKATASISGKMKSEDIKKAKAYDPNDRTAMLTPALLVHVGLSEIL